MIRASKQRTPHLSKLRKTSESEFRVPLPPGEGGAKRRVRASMLKCLGLHTLCRPFGPPSPGGRRTRSQYFPNLESSEIKRRIKNLPLKCFRRDVGLRHAHSPLDAFQHHLLKSRIVPRRIQVAPPQLQPTT